MTRYYRIYDELKQDCGVVDEDGLIDIANKFNIIHSHYDWVDTVSKAKKVIKEYFNITAKQINEDEI